MHETAIQHVNSPAHLSIWSCSPAADLAAWHCHLQCEAQISFLPPGHGLLLLCSTSDTHQALPWKFNLLNEQKKLWGCFCFIHPPQGCDLHLPCSLQVAFRWNPGASKAVLGKVWGWKSWAVSAVDLVSCMLFSFLWLGKRNEVCSKCMNWFFSPLKTFITRLCENLFSVLVAEQTSLEHFEFCN